MLRFQATVPGPKQADETSHNHEVCSQDESGADDRRRDSRLKSRGVSQNFPPERGGRTALGMGPGR